MKAKIYEKAVCFVVAYSSRTGSEYYIYNLEDICTWQQNQVRNTSNNITSLSKITDIILDMKRSKTPIMAYYDWIRLADKEERKKYLCLEGKNIDLRVYRAYIDPSVADTMTSFTDLDDIVKGAEYTIPKTIENYTYLNLKNSYWRFTS